MHDAFFSSPNAFYIVILAVVVLWLFALAIRIFREYERGVVFTLGRFTRVAGPGFVLVVPVIQQVVKLDLRTVVDVVPPQDVITRDNVSVKVNAVIYYRMVDPQRAVINVANYMSATSQLAQTTLRSVLGKHELDELLAERDKLNATSRRSSTGIPTPGASRLQTSRSRMSISTRT